LKRKFGHGNEKEERRSERDTEKIRQITEEYKTERMEE
jgi:hypothetical protein